LVIFLPPKFCEAKKSKKKQDHCKKGLEFQSIKADDVASFYTEHKLIF